MVDPVRGLLVVGEMAPCGPAEGEVVELPGIVATPDLQPDAVPPLEHVRDRPHLDRVLIDLPWNDRYSPQVRVVGLPRTRLPFVELAMRRLQPSAAEHRRPPVRPCVLDHHDEVPVL